MISATEKQHALIRTHGTLTPTAQSVAAWFKAMLQQKTTIEQLRKIKLIVADIDGSLTDGGIEYTKTCEGTRWFSTQDGYATRKAIERNIMVAFLSGKGAGSGQLRATMLGIPHDLCILGVQDKRPAVADLQQKFDLGAEQVIMFGDDHLDAQVKIANPKLLFVAPANAPFYVQHVADITLPIEGGHHAFRLLVDLLLFAQGNHFAQDIVKSALE